VVDKIDAFGPTSIVCYGIGPVSRYQVPQYQLALVLLLRDRLKTKVESVWIFDPCDTDLDNEVYRYFGLNPIASNENGRRKVNERTLFYMPHCEEFLYDNVWAANWTIEGNGIENLSFFIYKYLDITLFPSQTAKTAKPWYNRHNPFNDLCFYRLKSNDDGSPVYRDWNEDQVREFREIL
ncbi:sensitivity to red-light reduced protein, partial [Spiromyces aspiralis]